MILSALMLWVNYPSNPTGAIADLNAVPIGVEATMFLFLATGVTQNLFGGVEPVQC